LVVGRDDQRTEGDVRVEGKGFIGLVISSIDSGILSSNVITSIVETTALSYSTFERMKRT